MYDGNIVSGTVADLVMFVWTDPSLSLSVWIYFFFSKLFDVSKKESLKKDNESSWYSTYETEISGY